MTEERESMIVVNGKEFSVVTIHDEPALKMSDAAAYLGITPAALHRRLERLAALYQKNPATTRKVSRWELGPGTRDRYILIKDLDWMKTPRQVDEGEE